LAKKIGVLIGIIWVNIRLVLFSHPKSMKATQIGKDRVRETIRWLVAVKIYGITPSTLEEKIVIRRLVKIKV